jgi:4-hydroxybenzoyl-CoA thioesterase
MDAEPEGQARQKRNVPKIRVEFGHCDPAQIVYYPNFFMWFDQGTQHLFESVGIHWRDLPRHWGYHAPLVDAQARFVKTVTWGDDIEIESQVEHWSTRSFKIRHTVRRAGSAELLAERFEVRAMVAPDPGKPEQMNAVAIPEEIKRRFAADADATEVIEQA